MTLDLLGDCRLSVLEVCFGRSRLYLYRDSVTACICPSSTILLTDLIFFLVLVGSDYSTSFTSSMVVSRDLTAVGDSVAFALILLAGLGCKLIGSLLTLW
jgi:hypothetical protein